MTEFEQQKMAATDINKNDLDDDSLLQYDVINEEFSPEAWAKFTGLKIKKFNEDELDAFQKPFRMGWRRELVLRANLTYTGKKIGDVYYFSPCKKVKLRSYVEMGLYLKKHQDCELEPENFTFARQPIYRQPEEIIRHALPKGSIMLPLKNLSPTTLEKQTIGEDENKSDIPPLPQLTPIGKSLSNKNVRNEKNSINGDENQSFKTECGNKNSEENLKLNNSLAEGRSRRKRVAPSRFEDEDYSDASPFKKKNKTLTSTTTNSHQKISNQKSNAVLNIKEIGNSNDSNGKKTVNVEKEKSDDECLELATSTEKKEDTKADPVEEKQIETIVAEQDEKSNSESVSSELGSEPEQQVNTENKDTSNEEVKTTQSLKPKSGIKTEKADSEVELEKASSNDSSFSKRKSKQPIPPCSIMCGSRKGNLPNLLCSRCLCLFHLECVCAGIFLKDSNLFVCPNCLQPNDMQNAKEKITGNEFMNGNYQDQQMSHVHSRSNKLSLNKPNMSSITAPSASNKKDNLSSNYPKMNGNSYPPTHRNKMGNNIVNGPNLNEIKKKPVNSSQSCNNMNVRLPAGTHLYRVNTGNLMNPQYINRPNAVIGNKFPNPNSIPNMNHYLKKISSNTSELFQNKSNHSFIANGNGVNASFASRRSHLDSMNRSLLSSQHLLQSIQKAASLKVNPIDFNSNDFTAYLKSKKPNKQKFREYLNKRKNTISVLTDGYEMLKHVFEYLTVGDLIQCKQVNKMFNRLASEKSLWSKLTLKNLLITNWTFFGENILKLNLVTDLNLEGIRLKNDQSFVDLWSSFSDMVPHLDSIKRLKLGKISSTDLSKLINLELKDKSNPLLNLIELSVKNLYEDNSNCKLCDLGVLEDIGKLKDLNFLRLESKQGFSSDENSIFLLNQLSDILPNLKYLSLPSLKGYSIDKFEFLVNLTQLEKLEIGSCESWTTCEISSDDDSDDSNNLNSESENSFDDLEENENQENENNFANAKNKRLNRHKGAFKYLSQLKNLKELTLNDVIIDETSNQLPLVVEKMKNLETLNLGCLTVSPDATQTLNMLCNTIKSKLLCLKNFYISTEDSHTNKCVFDLLLKRLDNLRELKWKVGSQVEDSGVCLVPFIKDRCIESDLENEENLELTTSSDSIEMVEMCYLNDVLQKHLNKTRITIIPQ